MQGSSRKSGVLATGGWEKRAWTCLLTLMVLFSVADLCADEGNVRYKVLGKEKQYEDIKKRLRDERQSVKKIAGRESTILGELDKVDRVLAGNRRALKLVEKSLKRITKDISTSEGAVSSLKAKQRKYTQLLEKRLVTMYKMRGGGEVRVIMSSLSPTDLERRYRYMNTLLDSNAAIIDEYGKNITLLDGELKKLKNLQSHIM